MKQLLILFTLLVTLSACQQTTNIKAPDDKLSRTLEKVAADARLALVSLSETNNAIAAEMMSRQQRKQYIINNAVTPPGLGKRVNIKWYGDLEAGLRRLAKIGRYEYKVRGRSPSNAIVVKMRYKRKIIDHIRNISAQAGDKANIVIIPDKKLIELTYADHY